jgi:hypothetical protein
MRVYLIILETIARDRQFEILHSTYDRNEALDELTARSDEHEKAIIAGKCKVYMTTYLDKD